MQIVVMAANKATILNEDGLRDHIIGKSNRVIRPQMAANGARSIIAHNGVNSGGGCPAHVTYQGRVVFHESRGQKGHADGCTVFFTSAAALQAADAHATGILLAVGFHDKDVKGQPHYELDWKRSNWFQGNSIQF